MNVTELFYAGYLACWILATRNSLVPGGTKRRGWQVTAVQLTVGLGSLLTGKWQGSYLDSEGFLHEPFFLIGGGSLLCLAGSCLTLGMLVRGLVRRELAVGRRSDNQTV